MINFIIIITFNVEIDHIIQLIINYFGIMADLLNFIFLLIEFY